MAKHVIAEMKQARVGSQVSQSQNYNKISNEIDMFEKQRRADRKERKQQAERE